MIKRPILLLCLALASSACQQAPEPVTVRFEARLGEAPMGCGTVSDGFAMTDLRFFVAGPALLRSDGAEVPITLGENARWQQPGLALVDLEDGSSSCANGTADMNATLTGTVPAGDYEGLAFTLGVPFDLNHADPLQAHVPLDDSTMHWHWRSGYKFLRAGYESSDDGFWIHLGSAGCEGTVQNISGCRYDNRTVVTLPDFRPGKTVLIDFAPLIEATEAGDASPSDCSSGPAEEACRAGFAVLGLDFDSGSQVTQQQLFRVASR